MRKLITRDIPAFCRVLKAIGVDEELREVARVGKAADVWAAGYDLVFGIFDKITEKKAEDLLYEFFAGPFEMTGEEVANMEITELFANIKQMVQENDLNGFFKSAATLMK
jgi:hypothetical protein